MKQLMLLVEESQASKEAKAKGLEYQSFGRYGKNGKQTHTVKNGHLVPIKSGGKTASGKRVAADPNPITGPGDAMGRSFAQGGPQFEKPLPRAVDAQDAQKFMTGGGAKDFSSETDTWYDDLAGYREGGTIAMEDKALSALRQLSAKSPTQNTVAQIRKVVPALGQNGVGKKLAAQVDRVLANGYKGEFKKQFGDHSQASELLSMIRQAVSYND